MVRYCQLSEQAHSPISEADAEIYLELNMHAQYW